VGSITDITWKEFFLEGQYVTKGFAFVVLAGVGWLFYTDGLSSEKLNIIAMIGGMAGGFLFQSSSELKKVIDMVVNKLPNSKNPEVEKIYKN